MENREKLYAMIMELPPDLQRIETELKTDKYTDEDMAWAVCTMIQICQSDYRDIVKDYEKGFIDARIKNRSEKLNSTYIYPVCELFLKYGMKPNTVVFASYNTNIMYELFYVDNGYVGADTLRLLLENGGDPNLEIDSETLFRYADFDIWFDTNEIYDEDPEWFDSKFHYWLVLRGFIGEQTETYNENEIRFKNHEQFTHRKEDGHLCIVKK